MICSNYVLIIALALAVEHFVINMMNPTYGNAKKRPVVTKRTIQAQVAGINRVLDLQPAI